MLLVDWYQSMVDGRRLRRDWCRVMVWYRMRRYWSPYSKVNIVGDTKTILLV